MNIAVILAGGKGTRMGFDIPKQFIEVNQKAVIAYCLKTFEKHSLIDKIHIAADEKWRKFITEQANKYLSNVFFNKFCGFTPPGETRQLSAFNALKEIDKYADKNDNVIIHDSARPNLTEELITKCVGKMNSGCDGVLPVLPMKDTIYYNDGGSVRLINRSCLFAGQAPEIFNFKRYYAANIKLMPNEILKINGSAEPAILAGMNIEMIDGDENNFKITTKADLERFERCLYERICPS